MEFPLAGLPTFIDGGMPGYPLTSSHDPGLVLLSYLVASFAAYTALDFAGRVRQDRLAGATGNAWLAGGACAMGAGIWGMHFIAMLAFRLPVPVEYALGTTLLSLAIAIALSGFALHRVTRGDLPPTRLLAGGTVMGLGVAAMHYTGMAAMRMDAFMFYRRDLFAASLVNAVACSVIALLLVFRVGASDAGFTRPRQLLVSALVMGVAISGMHYLAIEAGICVSPHRPGAVMAPLDPRLQTLVIGGVALLFTSVILIVSAENQRVSARLARQNQALTAEIAERRRVETVLQETVRQVEAANRAKSEFLSNMSHELCTPMHAIRSFTQFGLARVRDAPREKLAHYFGNIETSAARLMALLNDLLDLSKIEAGRMEFAFREIEIAGSLATVLGEFEALARARPVTLASHVGPGITTATFDETRMHQVIRNLVGNAIKFCRPGGAVTVTVAPGQAPHDRDQEGWRISVVDDGPGIPESELELIFDKFVQSSTTKTGSGGTGLGLAIAREIIIAHGGTIAATNRPQGGAEFRVRLPRELPAA